MNDDFSNENIWANKKGDFIIQSACEIRRNSLIGVVRRREDSAEADIVKEKILTRENSFESVFRKNN